ncbi:MAG TPA: restriction endonuclease subunit S, partial [Thermoclostridium sp.]
ILHKAFNGELTAKWREENGVDFEREWEENLLGEICEINPKRISTKELDDDIEVSFVPMSSVSDIKGVIEQPLVKKLAEVKKGFTNFSVGDVIFAKITPCMENGKSAVVENLMNGIGFGSTEFHVLRCSERLYNRYLYHLVRWKKFRDEARQVMTGAVGQQRVPKEFLEQYTINTPPVKEQIEIVRILDNLLEKEQKARELCDIIIKNIEQLKKSILARAFRGELNTNNPGEESALELLKEVIQERMES